MLLVLQVVDLLVAMCRAALQSPRRSIIFEPYPCVVDPNNPRSLAFSPKVAAAESYRSECRAVLLFGINELISRGRERITTSCKNLLTASC